MAAAGESNKSDAKDTANNSDKEDDDNVDEAVITEKLDGVVLEDSDDEDIQGNALHDEALDVPPEADASTNATTKNSEGSSKWKTAYQNTKHFAGGLISHPFESTKHFSILRHSHGLVFYRGPLTNVAVTIFSDQPLPADRTLWLQTKGWAGKRGLKVKTFCRASRNWMDVTPSETLDP